MKALQFITLASPVLPVVAGIIVGYFNMWWDIIQSDHTEIVVVAGVGVVRMVYIPEIAGDFDGFFFTEPQNISTIYTSGYASQPADHRSRRYVDARKQSFAMNIAVCDIGGCLHVRFEIPLVTSIILQLTLEYNKDTLKS
jgi:hypothetical protein